MNQTPTTTWSPMVSGPDDDFASFLEFNDLQLNFPAFDDNVHQDGDEMQQESVNALDTRMDNEVGMMGNMQQQQIDPSLMPSTPMAGLSSINGSNESLMDLNMQAQMHRQRQQHQYQQDVQNHYQRQGMIPPTPTSIEMHGGGSHYYPQIDPQTQAVYEHYARKQQDQIIFTPLVSPAVTPLDNQFRMPEFTIPGEYFSPLTSPALEAQNQMHAAQRSVYGVVRGSDTSDTTSPIDMTTLAHSPLNSATNLRKSKRKTSSVPKPAARAVRQSPAMKPQSRKSKSSSTVIPPKEIAEIMEEARVSTPTMNTHPPSGKLGLPYTQDSSEAGSISPEPLSEALMPPPATPRPGSAGRSPYLKPKVGHSLLSQSVDTNSPATPASLMRIQKQAQSDADKRKLLRLKEQTSSAEAEMEQIMEDIVLPESATAVKPSLKLIDTSSANNPTPTLSAQMKPPGSAPLTANSAVFPSPHINAMPSPSPSLAGKRAEPKAIARNNKKRNSSSHVSPALRPRISPSIQPLLPEGSPLSASTTTLLLASKSNYQNILEGTHLPGVSYPSALATNLTSKRTSHKIAEQGRRNRINCALGEIASLLPAGMGGTSGGEGGDGDGEGKGSGGGGGGSGGNSKARTVEAAIEYIRLLKGEVKELKGKVEGLEKRLEGGSPSPDNDAMKGMEQTPTKQAAVKA
ncbi:MAG: hypothetical protein MMC33_009591 [Icmadophila ericetorum]|nr:hypothetical protein [Icmadophila ericetorum]